MSKDNYVNEVVDKILFECVQEELNNKDINGKDKKNNVIKKLANIFTKIPVIGKAILSIATLLGLIKKKKADEIGIVIDSIVSLLNLILGKNWGKSEVIKNYYKDKIRK